MHHLPILYSFRRCPYAIRARLALITAQCHVEHREIELRNKPSILLELSPKGTVPVMQLPEGRVIDESLDIMLYALNQTLTPKQAKLIQDNDNTFKHWLDRYKYDERYPEHTQEYYRQQGEVFLSALNAQLQHSPYLDAQAPHLVDMAIFPFVRQFAHVDSDWFDQSPYPHLRDWLNRWLNAEVFKTAMQKYPIWQSGDKPRML